MFVNRMRPGTGEIPPPDKCNLLDVDLRAGVFKLLLDVFSFALGDAFLDSLRSSFDEILGFLQAETGDSADFLDDVDLVERRLRRGSRRIQSFLQRLQQEQHHRQQQQRPPVQRRKRPTFLQASWTAQQLPGRSGWKGLPRFWRDQPFFTSLYSVRTGFELFHSEVPPYAASSFRACAPMTRATAPAGALTIWAMRVAGV
jgi:hypothetical protein